MMRKGFYISQVKITGEGKKDAVVEFTDGVNVILGPSNSGKSLITESTASMDLCRICIRTKSNNRSHKKSPSA